MDTLLKISFKNALCLVMALTLSSCGTITELFTSPDNGEEITETTVVNENRISVLQLQKDLEFKDTDLQNIIFNAPDIWENEFWPQAGGYPNHALQHVNFTPDEPKRIWSKSIGSGSNKIPLTTQPIVVAGVIFTLDSRNKLRAIRSDNGREIWAHSMKDKEEGDDVIPGGIAFSAGTLFVTNGFKQLIAVDPQQGKTLWTADLPAPSRAAPSALDGRVFVSTLDSRLLAFDAKTGQSLWDQQGFSESTTLLGASVPAVNSNIVVPAYSSGEVYALRVENGAVAWTDNLAATRRTGALSTISDIKALPVIDRGIIYAVSFSGLMVAIDQRTGQRIWQREIGGAQTPWVSGNLVFVITKEQKLVALERETGSISWVTELPAYKNKSQRTDPITWNGPILAGGRLMIFSSHGKAFDIDPQDGRKIRGWATRANVHIPPIIAKQTLYLLSDNGTLYAYR